MIIKMEQIYKNNNDNLKYKFYNVFYFFIGTEKL